MSHEISSLRSELLMAQQQLPQLLEACLARGPLLPGSLYYYSVKPRGQSDVTPWEFWT